jgi:hypothetical protein
MITAAGTTCSRSVLPAGQRHIPRRRARSGESSHQNATEDFDIAAVRCNLLRGVGKGFDNTAGIFGAHTEG